MSIHIVLCLLPHLLQMRKGWEKCTWPSSGPRSSSPRLRPAVWQLAVCVLNKKIRQINKRPREGSANDSKSSISLTQFSYMARTHLWLHVVPASRSPVPAAPWAAWLPVHPIPVVGPRPCRFPDAGDRAALTPRRPSLPSVVTPEWLPQVASTWQTDAPSSAPQQLRRKRSISLPNQSPVAFVGTHQCGNCWTQPGHGYRLPTWCRNHCPCTGRKAWAGREFWTPLGNWTPPERAEIPLRWAVVV